MDRADLILNNRAPRRQIMWAVLLLLLGIVLGLPCSAYCADGIMREQIRSMLGVAGGAAFTEASLSEAAIAQGIEQLEQYGVSEAMPPRLMAGWEALRWQLFAVMQLFFLIPVLAMTVYGIRSAIQDYRRLEQLRSICLQLRDGNAVTLAEMDTESDSIGRIAEGIALIEKQTRHMRASLQAEKQALADFLNDLSHQLKTALAVIRLNSDLLSEPSLLAESERTQLFEEIAAQLAHMETLIRTSLKLAKLEAGAVEYRMQKCSLLATCRCAAESIAPLLRRDGITVTLGETDALWQHDTVWLREALENIMKNALDHAQCTAIHMEVAHNPVFAKIRISDNGKGIPQEEIPRLFDRFGKKSNSSDMQSVGIGLAIAKKIIVSHGGEITVFSSPEEGTTFEIIFLK